MGDIRDEANLIFISSLTNRVKAIPTGMPKWRSIGKGGQPPKMSGHFWLAAIFATNFFKSKQSNRSTKALGIHGAMIEFPPKLGKVHVLSGRSLSADAWSRKYTLHCVFLSLLQPLSLLQSNVCRKKKRVMARQPLYCKTIVLLSFVCCDLFKL